MVRRTGFGGIVKAGLRISIFFLFRLFDYSRNRNPTTIPSLSKPSLTTITTFSVFGGCGFRQVYLFG